MICWLIISGVLHHSPELNSNGNAHEIHIAFHLKITHLKSKPHFPVDKDLIFRRYIVLAKWPVDPCVVCTHVPVGSQWLMVCLRAHCCLHDWSKLFYWHYCHAEFMWLNGMEYLHFYPRPVLAFGYCRCLRLCVCVCVCLSVCLSVCQSLACPGDNSGPVQARIAKFGPKMQKTLVKVPIVLGGNWPWPSRSNLTSKSEFTQFWACPDHNSLPIQARITKFGPEVENSLVKVPIVLGGSWPRPSRSNLI